MNVMESMTRKGPIGGVRRRIEDDNECHECVGLATDQILNAGSPQGPYEWEPTEMSE